MPGALASWKDGPARQALVEFVERTVSDAVPVDERVAVFDNDGTLWCEKPMPIQLDFILRRLVAMAEAKPELQEHQPWKAAFERDYGWLRERPRGDLRANARRRRGPVRPHLRDRVRQAECVCGGSTPAAHERLPLRQP